MRSRLLAVCTLIISLSAGVRAEADFDRLTKQFQAAVGKDDAAGVALLFQTLADAGARANAAATPQLRRPLEMLLNDISDSLVKFKSEAALAAIASSLGRLPPDALGAACFGLKAAPAHAEIDAAALKMLAGGADYRVKTSILDLMAAHKHTAAVEKILPFVTINEILPVQIAACRALACLPDKKSVPVLLKYMAAAKAKGGGRMIYEANVALRAISGQSFIPDASTWQDWWSKNEQTFEVDATKSAAPEFNYELKDQSEISYYEIPLFENRIVFVLDVSGSMAFGGKPNRLEKAQAELNGIIARLSDKQWFNILTYSMDVDRWQTATGLVQATEPMKKAAKAFVDSQKPKTGTMTTTAMEETLRNIAARTSCETIFLVTDGMPSPWRKDITPEHQERQIDWMNLPLKVRINTIGIYTRDGSEKVQEDTKGMQKFLQDLAAQNDGVYKEIGAVK